jgi:hypothetical protein
LMSPLSLWLTTTISYRGIGQITSKALEFLLKAYSRNIFILLPRYRMAKAWLLN